MQAMVVLGIRCLLMFLTGRWKTSSEVWILSFTPRSAPLKGGLRGPMLRPRTPSASRSGSVLEPP